jgi:hypothetical protein
MLADRFGPRRTALGLMFDPGFRSGLSDPTFNAVPREGCAVFLDAIRDLRGGGAAYQQEVAFTTVHEIGHVFNLWHIPTTPNFMAQSPARGPFGPGAFFFAAAHARFLSAIDVSQFVAPGGSDFGRRGTLGPSGDNPFNVRQRTGVKVTIAAPQQEFWRFEPVQHDVKVSSTRRTIIGDVVDPGYDDFDVWIETPDGRRRRYHSPVLFCGNSGTLTIAPGGPFRRDIRSSASLADIRSAECGVHRVFCTLRLGRTVVCSNTVEMVVRRGEPRSLRYERLKAVLTDPRHARLLYYNASPMPHRSVTPLVDAARALRRTPAAANVRYSLGRALVEKASQSGRIARRNYLQTADTVLKTALDSDMLTSSRRRRAAQLVNEIEA